MPIINVTLPSNGTRAKVEQYNDPITTILATLNGGLDDDNIASLSGTKIIAGTIPQSALNSSTYADWIVGILPAVSSVAYNGNRSYDVTFATTVAALLSPGKRYRGTRSVVAPNQSANLNGSTQYFNNTSPNKMTFTDDFTCSAWIKLNSATNCIIASRYNGTSGWRFGISAAGQLFLEGYSGSSSNFRGVLSYQSLPLNKWVHVTAQLDMSSYTLSATTMYVMIDGIDAPSSLYQGGSNPSSLVQAGNFEVGSNNGGLLPFPGKLAQVAIYSAKITQANIRATISQGLSGSESNLASGYSFNNSLSDLSATTPNTLSAQGSATSNSADSPFGCQGDGTISTTLDYGIVEKVSTTVATIQVPEGCTIPTSGGVTATAFSGVKVPYNFPADQGKWTIDTYIRTQTVQASPGTGTWYNLSSFQINAPVGAWDLQGFISILADKTGSLDVNSTIGTSFSTETDAELTAFFTGSGVAGGIGYRSKSIVVASATPYYALVRTNTASVNNIQLISVASSWPVSRLTLKNTYI